MEQNNGNVAEPVAPVVTAQPEPVVAPQAPAAAPAPQLPVEAPDRTRQQFDKLIESNRRLFQEVEALKTANAPKVQPVKPANVDDFVEIDPISGDRFINDQRLKARLEELNKKASEVDGLRQTVEGMQISTQNQEVDRQSREAYSTYPELNPNGASYDSNFNKLVRATLTDSFYAQDDYGGRPLTFKEAGDAVKALYPSKPAQAAAVVAVAADDTKVAEAAAAAAQASKEQGSAQAASQPRAQVQQAASDDEELQNLRYRTRYLNDDKALAERIMHTEHILPKDAVEV